MIKSPEKSERKWSFSWGFLGISSKLGFAKHIAPAIWHHDEGIIQPLTLLTSRLPQTLQSFAINEIFQYISYCRFSGLYGHGLCIVIIPMYISEKSHITTGGRLAYERIKFVLMHVNHPFLKSTKLKFKVPNLKLQLWVEREAFSQKVPKFCLGRLAVSQE